MSYLEVDDKKLVEDIYKRKEFNIYDKTQNKIKEGIIPKYFIEREVKKNNILELQSYQSFVQNFINPKPHYPEDV